MVEKFDTFTGLSRLRVWWMPALLFYVMPQVAAQKNTVSKTGILRINLINTINQQPALTNDSTTYHNPSGETFTLHKLKYYLSNFGFTNQNKVTLLKKNDYFLINNADSNSLSFEIQMPKGRYFELEFLLGVDSLRNCSGAQTGALDPLNDMFWTWNSGYVSFKLEGSSPASNQTNQRFEYHIGGYAGVNKSMRKINLLPYFGIVPGKTTELFIEMNLDKLWSNPFGLTIKETPICTTPGPLAKRIADNYAHLFSVKNVLQPK